MRQDRIPIDMESALEPMSLAEYIEDCRMKLWDCAFISTFKGHDCFKKLDDFVGFKGADLAVRRVLFRYEILRTCCCLRFSFAFLVSNGMSSYVSNVLSVKLGESNSLICI